MNIYTISWYGFLIYLACVVVSFIVDISQKLYGQDRHITGSSDSTSISSSDSTSTGSSDYTSNGSSYTKNVSGSVPSNNNVRFQCITFSECFCFAVRKYTGKQVSTVHIDPIEQHMVIKDNCMCDTIAPYCFMYGVNFEFRLKRGGNIVSCNKHIYDTSHQLIPIMYNADTMRWSVFDEGDMWNMLDEDDMWTLWNVIGESFCMTHDDRIKPKKRTMFSKLKKVLKLPRLKKLFPGLSN